jgi:hypothetical protein
VGVIQCHKEQVFYACFYCSSGAGDTSPFSFIQLPHHEGGLRKVGSGGVDYGPYLSKRLEEE